MGTRQCFTGDSDSKYRDFVDRVLASHGIIGRHPAPNNPTRQVVVRKDAAVGGLVGSGYGGGSHASIVEMGSDLDN